MTTVDREARAIRATGQGFIRDNIGLIGVAGLIVVTSAMFASQSPHFLDINNLLNVVRQQAPAFVIAVGLTFVITTKGIDLSVGSVAALTGALGATVVAGTGSAWLAIGTMLLVGGIVGFVNGYFVAVDKLPAFIVTLAGLTAYQGVALLITGGTSVPYSDETFAFIGRGNIGGIAIPVLIASVIAVVGWFVFARMRFGMHVVATGSNIVGARRSGVPTRRVVISVYVISGLLAAVAGLIITGRLGAGSSSTAQDMALLVVTGVVLGGTSFFGGRGSIIGSVLGVFLLGIITNGLTLLRFDPFYVPIVQGAILLFALWVQRKAGLQSSGSE